MRTVLVLLLCCPALRADFSYRSRIQIGGGQPVVATHLIKGRLMATLTRQHTSVIDLSAETVTEIDLAKKTYFVTPFAKVKRSADDGSKFKVSMHAPADKTKPFGIVNATESVFEIAGGSNSSLIIAVDSWIGTIPGYDQMNAFIAMVASKLGWPFAAGFGDPELNIPPEALQAFGEAAKQLNRSVGAPLQTTIKISGADGTIAEASIELDTFGGGVQDVSKFVPPANFKKVDAP